MQLKVREENVSQGVERGRRERMVVVLVGRGKAMQKRGGGGGGGLVDEEVWALVPQVTWSCCNPQRRPLKAANVPRCQAAGCCTISYSSSSLPSSSSHLGLHSRPMLRLLAPEKFFTAKSQRVSRETVCTTQIWGLLICLIAHVG